MQKQRILGYVRTCIKPLLLHQIKYITHSINYTLIWLHDGTTSLMLASSDGHLMNEMIHSTLILLQDGATSLLLAASGGHFEVVNYLVESGADVQAKNRVTRNIYRTIVFKLWISYMINIIHYTLIWLQFDETSLMFASSGGHFEVVRYLVDLAGADIEATDTVSRNTYLIIIFTLENMYD